MGDARTPRDSDEPRPSIIAAISDDGVRSHVDAELNDWTALTFLPTTADLVAATGGLDIDLVLLHLDPAAVSDLSGAGTWPGRIARFHDSRPDVPLIAYGEVSRETSRMLLAAGRAGVQSLVLRGYDRLGDGVRRALRRSSSAELAREIVDAIFSLPTRARPILEQCIRATPGAVVTVDALAAALGIHRRTLSNRLRALGLPAPETLIGWCRLMVAARRLEDPTVSVNQIARELRFGSASELRGMLARYTGLTPAAVRAAGGLTCVARAFSNGGAIAGRSAEREVAVPGDNRAMPAGGLGA